MIAKNKYYKLESHALKYVNLRAKMQPYYKEYLKILKLRAGIGMISPISPQAQLLKTIFNVTYMPEHKDNKFYALWE